MEALHKDTLQWAKDRALTTNGKITSQALKLGSEVSELAYNLSKHKDIKDDIGDCLVVLTILCSLQGKGSLIDIIEAAPHKSLGLPSFISLVYNLGELQDKAIKNQEFDDEVRGIVSALGEIAVSRNTNLKDAWVVAYDDIKDRKGFLNNEGTFIKDTDSNYSELYEIYKAGF
ncbi:MAG: hypothetical protein DRG30_06980 [Epsilonproteobacteria bacterium]|nr:MAG: hypothetical protein DRG30_06980 [Campylobacterota bacterium]